MNTCFWSWVCQARTNVCIRGAIRRGRGHGDVHSTLWFCDCPGALASAESAESHWRAEIATTVSANKGLLLEQSPQPSPCCQAAGVVVIPYDHIPNQALPLLHFVLLDGKATFVPDDCSVPQRHSSAKVDHFSVLLRLLQSVFNSLSLKSSDVIINMIQFSKYIVS